jgi:hypothetical protein
MFLQEIDMFVSLTMLYLLIIALAAFVCLPAVQSRDVCDQLQHFPVHLQQLELQKKH